MYSFHTPGHKGRRDLLAPVVFPDYDLTELPGLDMLHNPQGVLAEAQKKAAEFYRAEETFFLVNGATVGNQAMFLALLPKAKTKKVRIERKAHRSVIGALILSGLTPEYIPSVIHPDFNLPLGLDVAQLTADLEHIDALHLTSPSYYGTVSDLAYVLRQRDKHKPNLPVMVDQAHGAHFTFGLFPQGAVEQGADLVVHSTHKTLPALTQAAMLHVQGTRIDRFVLRDILGILQTSSPSYLLLASLEQALDIRAESLWNDLFEEVQLLRQKLNGPLRILTEQDCGSYGIKEVDWSKILVNVSPLGISAAEAVEYLRHNFRIEPELWDEFNILFVLGLGNKPEEVRALSAALEELVKRFRSGLNSAKRSNANASQRSNVPVYPSSLPPVRLSPREAWLSTKRKIAVKESLGKISAETISVYPPGIPLIACGEEITEEVLTYLLQADKYNWQGWQGSNRGEILVVDM